MTLYDQIGGEAALDASVELFYQKILADDQLTPFFANTPMPRQKAMQKAFLTYAFGGPSNYTGRTMRDAHKNAVANGLNENHFNRVAGHLQSTLEELNVPGDLVQQVMTIAASTKADVLNQ